MRYYSPLRYPGGKRRLVPVVARLIETNGLKNFQYAEPYAGGASIALALLLEEYAADVHINDLSRPVFAFWYSVLNHTKDFCRRVESTSVTMKEWHRQRAVYDRRESANILDLGFSTLFLNRTNRSGIINAGVIGGKQQSGEWKLDVRFNKSDLVQRIRLIGRYRSRIHLYQSDALDFTNQVVAGLGKNSFSFYDPPYIENGDGLYLNEYDIEGHRQLAYRVGDLRQPWVVTYDCAAVHANLYPMQRRLIYGLQYTAQSRYEGHEVMFLANGLQLPESWRKSRRIELSTLYGRGDKADHAVYGKMENMKPQPAMNEGPAALERFRKAMKTIVAVPKTAVVPARSKARTKRKKASSRKG
jgi:DNA adenine methylase